MKHFEIVEFGSLPELTEQENPLPQRDQVVVRMHAWSLNARDLSIADGTAGVDGRHLPLVPLSDGAGEVIAVGVDVDRWHVGDRVVSTLLPDWISGVPLAAMTERVTGASAHGTLSLGPERIGAERGRPVEPGDTLLTIGTGGVSIMALQVAQNLGAKVIILSGSDEKLGRARDLGAWATINHRETTDWPAVVLELTDGVGVDHVVEVGGPGTLERSIRSVRTGGRVSLIGVLSGRTGRMNPMGVLENNVSIDGIFSGSRVMFEALNRFVASSGMHPVIDRTFAFEDAASAYGYLETGRHFGKIVITR